MLTSWFRWVFTIALVIVACDTEDSRLVLGESVESTGTPKKNLSGPMTDVYKFTDDKGVVHYVDNMDKVPPKYRKKARHPTGGTVSIVPSTSIDEVLLKHGITAEQFEQYTKKLPGKKSGGKKSGSHKNVIIYTTSWCPACTRARKYLNSRGVSFVEKDVGNSKSNLQEMLQKSGGARGVPVIDIHGKVIRGFNPRAVASALEQ